MQIDNGVCQNKRRLNPCFKHKFLNLFIVHETLRWIEYKII